jgi:hypothetical protein
VPKEPKVDKVLKEEEELQELKVQQVLHHKVPQVQQDQ